MATRNCIKCACEIENRWARLCTPCARSNRTDPVKRAAHLAVARAIRGGALLPARELICVDCALPAIEYDHREYAKPLQVDPVCRRCNLRRGPAIDSAAWLTSPVKAAAIARQHLAPEVLGMEPSKQADA